jgi:hypothetical protein
VRIDQIEIHAGEVDFPYEAVRPLEAKCEATTAFQKAPTMADVNLKLQQLAAGIGANAVINVAYNSGMSMTSWRSIKATGLAVRKLSDEVACATCAEMIKRAAVKCRFCGAERSPAATVAVSASEPLSKLAEDLRAIRGPQLPPVLSSSDNPSVFLWVIGIVVVLSFVGVCFQS